MTHFSTAESYSDELFENLFEPDIVLPSQFNTRSDNGLQGGERRLMAAILADGIEAYLSQVGNLSIACPVDRANEAIEWVETSDASYIFSFDSVCSALGINAQYLRYGLKRYVLAATTQEQAQSNIIKWKKIRRPRK